MSRKEVGEKLESIKAERQEVNQADAAKTQVHFRKLIDEVKPDIIMLQENWNTGEMYKLFEEKGYTLIRSFEHAFAFKNSVFELPLQAKASSTFVPDRTQFYDAGYELKPDMAVDVVHKETGLKLKVVSGHPKGFDGSAAKGATAQRKQVADYAKKALSDEPKERQKMYLTRTKAENGEGPGKGDASLDLTLTTIDKDPNAHVVIVGLDANATAKFQKSEATAKTNLHPKRMRLFEMLGYIFDKLASNATIMDGNDFVPRKYDYVSAKSKLKDTELVVREEVVPGVNNPELLKEPGYIKSDHLPAIATITIRPTI